MPAFGEATKRLVEGVSNFTLSPQNERIAFVRNRETGSSLIIADSKGNEEKTLAVIATPGSFLHPAWSPDGKIIACGVVAHRGNKRSVSLAQIRASDGTQEAITAEQWEQSYGLEWISDGSGLVLSALGKEPPSAIWFVSHPGGEVRRITMDGDSYADFTMTADSATLVCSQTETHHDLWRVPTADLDHADRMTKGASIYRDPSFTPDGRIVFASSASGNSELWIMDLAGTNQKQLTINDAAHRLLGIRCSKSTRSLTQTKSSLRSAGPTSPIYRDPRDKARGASPISSWEKQGLSVTYTPHPKRD